MKGHFIIVSKRMRCDQLDKGRIKRRYNKWQEKRCGTKNTRKRIMYNVCHAGGCAAYSDVFSHSNRFGAEGTFRLIFITVVSFIHVHKFKALYDSDPVSWGVRMLYCIKFRWLQESVYAINNHSGENCKTGNQKENFSPSGIPGGFPILVRHGTFVEEREENCPNIKSLCKEQIDLVSNPSSVINYHCALQHVTSLLCT